MSIKLDCMTQKESLNEVVECMGSNKAVYDKARKLQNDLDLGGLWKDSTKVLALIIRNLK
jgi:hypothetical protein